MSDEKKHTGPARGDGESYADYKKRRKADNYERKRKLSGRFIWVSAKYDGDVGKTAIKERD